MATQGRLSGKKVAIRVEEGFEQVEMTEPRKTLEQEGAGTDLISPCQGKVTAFQHDKRGDEFDVVEEIAEDTHGRMAGAGSSEENRRQTISKSATF